MLLDFVARNVREDRFQFPLTLVVDRNPFIMSTLSPGTVSTVET